MYELVAKRVRSGCRIRTSWQPAENNAAFWNVIWAIGAIQPRSRVIFVVRTKLNIEWNLLCRVLNKTDHGLYIKLRENYSHFLVVILGLIDQPFLFRSNETISPMMNNYSKTSVPNSALDRKSRSRPAMMNFELYFRRSGWMQELQSSEGAHGEIQGGLPKNRWL